MSSTKVSASTARRPATDPRLGVAAVGPGSVLGGYLLGQALGHGGMGVVYAATQGSTGRPAVVKVMSGRHAGDPVMRARFAREARAQAALHSAHVVPVLDHGEYDGLLWTAMEFIAGGDLADALRSRGTPPPAVALDLVVQVATGIADAHRAGLVHRDIKPANVLLDHTGGRCTAYLTDFGIARTPGSELTQICGMLGTAAYMAPELHHGAEASVASDVYALGCLLWAVLVGEAPYAWSTGDYQLMTAHISAPIPALRATDAWAVAVNAVLARAMAKDPGQRFRGATEFRDAVLAIS